MTRFLAALCIVALVFALALPSGAGLPAFLIASAPAFGAPAGAAWLHRGHPPAAPDQDPRAGLPARAPPLA